MLFRGRDCVSLSVFTPADILPTPPLERIHRTLTLVLLFCFSSIVSTGHVEVSSAVTLSHVSKKVTGLARCALAGEIPPQLETVPITCGSDARAVWKEVPPPQDLTTRDPSVSGFGDFQILTECAQG